MSRTKAGLPTLVRAFPNGLPPAMTEQQWLSSGDPEAMLGWLLRDSGSYGPYGDPECVKQGGLQRRLRLFAAECVRFTYDGEVIDRPEEPPWDWTAERLARHWADGRVSTEKIIPTTAERAALLRDIFGNPFRRDHAHLPYHKLSPLLTWHGGAIPALARRMYDSRDFSDMPVLADMLTEAGCTNEDILMHCRGMGRCLKCLGNGLVNIGLVDAVCDTCHFTHNLRKDAFGVPYHAGCGWEEKDAPHVRGCWVLDLLLGNE